MSTESSAPASGVSARQPQIGPEAWAVLPPLQRALEMPITPAAPLDTFTRGLAAHQDPSFLAPLTHGVEPMGGGVVDGLADLAPGSPRIRRDETALPVRPAAAPKTPADVQRSTWSSSTVWSSTSGSSESDGATQELETVRWEHPSAPEAGEGVGMEVTGTGAPEAPLAPLTSATGSVGHRSDAVADHASVQRSAQVPVQGSAPGPDQPVVLPADRALAHQLEHPVQRAADAGVDAPAPAVASIPSPTSVPVAESGPVPAQAPARRLAPAPAPVLPLAPLVVARTVASPVVQRTATSEEPPLRELPVARSVEAQTAPIESSPPAEPAAEGEAPLSGFAAAISTLQTPDPAPDSGADPVGTPSDEPAPTPTTRSVGDGREVGPVVGGPGRAEVAAPVQRLPELPVAGSVRPTPASAPEPSVALVGTRSLQSRYEELSSAVPPPPPVQRISFVPIQPGPPTLATSRVPQPSVQRVPATPSRPVPATPETRGPSAENRTDTVAAPEPAAPSGVGVVDPAPAAAVIDLEPEPAQVPTDSGTAPTGTGSDSATPAVAPVAIVQRQRADDVPMSLDPESAPVSFATMFADPSSAAGPTTSASYAATHGHTTVALPVAGLPTTQRTESPSVQRLSLPGVPKLPSMPTVPSLPSAPSLPQVPDLPSPADLPGAASGLADRAAGAASSAADSVGSAVDSARDAAGDAASSAVAAGSNAVQQATGAVAGAAGGAAGALGAAAGGADLDEMARRLFEPLSARLRAELWLDRERAGMVTDARL